MTDEPASGESDLLGLIQPYLSTVRKYVARRMPSCDVEDVIQESLLRIWARRAQIPLDHPGKYLMRVAKAVMVDRARYDHVRHQELHCSLEDYHHPSDPLTPDRVLLGREQMESLARAFSRLSIRRQKILLAIRIEGRNQKDVAETFGISVSAVEKHLSTALRILALETLEKEGQQLPVEPHVLCRVSGAKRKVRDHRQREPTACASVNFTLTDKVTQ